MARIVGVSSDRVLSLDRGWELRAADEPGWRAAIVPGTIGQCLLADATLETRLDTDARAWQYRVRFSRPEGLRHTLRFGGLATLASAHLNGEPILRSDNMFLEHDVDVSERLRRDNELVLHFDPLPSERRPRPRWRARMVENQTLRWIRTTLFGRMPGWTPRVAPVGPWRPVSLIAHGAVIVREARLSAEPGGRVTCALALDGAATGATLCVGDARARLVRRDGRWHGALTLDGALPWWPHTHGQPVLYPVRVELDDGVRIDLGNTGFRSVELCTEAGDFGFSVNGEPIFCRGACWMPLDALALDADAARLESALGRARDAGMNMLRVAANGVYAGPRFHALCDALGILVWQDFMFARLDYPDDDAFLADAKREAEQLFERLELSPSLAVVCGNSEVEQTAAMLGLEPKLAQGRLFGEILKPGSALPYVRSTPSGGALPFHPNRGLSHYFGVGAYRRPLSDARLAGVRFAAECLALSNLSDDAALDAPVPRDAGASWDFADVREHYLETCFGVNARELRTADPERWLELGRVVSGEVMARTFAEWRRRGSSCRGALLWHLADWCSGAGCGVLDVSTRPKPAYWLLRRALQPVAVLLRDEGLNGVAVHVLNETERPLAAALSLSLYRDGRLRVARVTTPLALVARASIELSVDALLGAFVDSSYAYRFGPPGHDAVVAALTEVATGAVLAEAFHFPGGPPVRRRTDLGLSARLRGDLLEVSAESIAYAVHVEGDALDPEDDYFHLEPGRARRLRLGSPGPVRVRAVNGVGSVHAADEARGHG